MTNKSYVGMGFHGCPVCGVKHDEVVLLNQSMEKTLSQNMFMGWSLCAKHQQLKDDGYVALIETNTEPKTLAEADRTGVIAHVRAKAWPQIFKQPVPDGGVCFVQPGVIQRLQGTISMEATP